MFKGRRPTPVEEMPTVTDVHPSGSPTRASLELLAPAGDWSSLEAAVKAGADAVYLGLTALNARRRARNFRPDEFLRAVTLAKQHGVRVYLTLNIDLAQRELGQAARMLELARQAGAHAVLVRDPALLLLRPLYPELEFHFSTQTASANRVDAEAAAELGASRVVLAREMSLSEIAAASAVPTIHTEVFAQGALCFCVSGRCLLSSWVGGRSGNRGTCTSPCRVPWSIAGQAAGTPLSMRDLSTIVRLGDLAQAGVHGLKIEGRLKSADWVYRAVQLYRHALDGRRSDPQTLQRQAAELGTYTGRAMTCDYLDGKRDALTGTALGRLAVPQGAPGGVPEVSPATEHPQADEALESPAAGAHDLSFGDDSSGPASSQFLQPADSEFATFAPESACRPETYDLDITVSDAGIHCRCTCGHRVEQWRLPRTVVRRPHKAVTIGNLLAHLSEVTVQGCRLERGTTNAPDFALVARASNAVVDRISAAVRLGCKPADGTVRIDLPPEVRDLLRPDAPHPANCRRLGDPPDRVRLEASAVSTFVRHVRPQGGLIVEGLSPGRVGWLKSICQGLSVVVALPPVMFEKDLSAATALVRQCAAAGVTVEVNSWGAWLLARRAGAAMEAGPGLAVLNSMAARALGRLGIQGVTLSLEADRRQYEELTAHCPLPCSLVVFGRPPLMITRVALPEEQLGKAFADRRGTRMIPRREGELVVFRPEMPFDLRDLRNDRIAAAHMVMDLVASPDPLAEWYDRPEPAAFHFNYDRSLA